jgi:hypothetical protein
MPCNDCARQENCPPCVQVCTEDNRREICYPLHTDDCQYVDVEPDNPEALGLARLLASYPLPTVQAAFRYLGVDMTTSTTKLKVDGFDSRMGGETGYIDFSDGTRIGYAPGTRQANVDGLFHCQQPYNTQKAGLEPGPRHWLLASAYVRETLKPTLDRIHAEAEAQRQQAAEQDNETPPPSE